MNGWIKIHRTMLEWEHFNEPSVVTVFLALLLVADKGRTEIGLGGLASITGLSKNTIRTALAKLVNSGEITRQTAKGQRTITTITNWNEYQAGQKLIHQEKESVSKIDTPVYQKLTQSVSKIDTHIKNKNNNNNSTTTTCACARERLMQELLTDARIELAMMQHHITEDVYRRMVDEILADWQFRDLPDSDYNLNHFSSVMRYKVQNNRNNGNNQQTGNASDPRAKLDADAAKAMATLASRIGKPDIVPF
jgi:DNA-binding transcriptional regulator GbsR (MarR family)